MPTGWPPGTSVLLPLALILVFGLTAEADLALAQLSLAPVMSAP